MTSYAELACQSKKAKSLYLELGALSLEMVWREGAG
jgi:hypothetical protein